jgi:hypothetical protein
MTWTQKDGMPLSPAAPRGAATAISSGRPAAASRYYPRFLFFPATKVNPRSGRCEPMGPTSSLLPTVTCWTISRGCFPAFLGQRRRIEACQRITAELDKTARTKSKDRRNSVKAIDLTIMGTAPSPPDGCPSNGSLLRFGERPMDVWALTVFALAAFAGGFVSGFSGFAMGLVVSGVWLHIITPTQTAALIAGYDQAANWEAQRRWGYHFSSSGRTPAQPTSPSRSDPGDPNR